MKITREALFMSKELLLHYENSTVKTIKDAWKEKNDKDYPEEYLTQEVLPYQWQDPLYMKMVHRFRNCRCRVAQFYHQIDPSNQRRFLFFRHLHNQTKPEVTHHLLVFMAWITNMKGSFDIEELCEHNTYLVSLWEKKPISFFYSLSNEQQAILVEEYNAAEVLPRPVERGEARVDRALVLALIDSQMTDIASMDITANLTASESDGEE